MAVILSMTYSKKLGLPNFSSHSCSVSLTVEIPDASVAAQESAKLYELLQTAVDNEIQHVGFMPDASTYGMKPSQNGHGAQAPHSNGSQGSYRNGEVWTCTDGQRGLILRIVNEHQLDKTEIEAMAQQLFGVGVKECSKMQASQLIEELLAKVGQGNGRRRWNRQTAARS